VLYMSYVWHVSCPRAMTSAVNAKRSSGERGEALPRRTQAERRARTRQALLAATIETLVDAGYAGVTTRRVAERASVSIGALQHHFKTKSELVAAAIEHLNAELARELVERAPTASRSERELAETLLDALWELHKGPLMAAVAELAVAARTDLELRDRLAPVQRGAIAASSSVAAHLFPRAAAQPALMAVIDTALGTLRGLALLRFVDPSGAEAMWPSTRRHLLTLAFGRSERRRP
jgi:AcrR family transcriptional regulator